MHASLIICMRISFTSLFFCVIQALYLKTIEIYFSVPSLSGKSFRVVSQFVSTLLQCTYDSFEQFYASWGKHLYFLTQDISILFCVSSLMICVELMLWPMKPVIYFCRCFITHHLSESVFMTRNEWLFNPNPRDFSLLVICCWPKRKVPFWVKIMRKFWKHPTRWNMGHKTRKL